MLYRVLISTEENVRSSTRDLYPVYQPKAGKSGRGGVPFATLAVRAVTLVFPANCLQWLPNSLQGKCGWIKEAFPDLARSRSECPYLGD